MPRLQTFERERAIGMLLAGQNMRNVARTFNVSHTTISCLRDRFQATGNINDAPRSRRSRSLTNADDRYIRLSALQDQFQPATLITSDINRTRNRHVTAQTVQNHLHQSGLHARRPVIGVQLTHNHRRLRLKWTRTHQRWNMAQWRTVLLVMKVDLVLTLPIDVAVCGDVVMNVTLDVASQNMTGTAEEV